MENETAKENKTEGEVTCTCIDCKKQFTPFQWDDDCHSCDDGDYLFEAEDYEGGDSYGTCPFCKGKGFHTMTETKRCKSCQEDYHMRLEYEED